MPRPAYKLLIAWLLGAVILVVPSYAMNMNLAMPWSDKCSPPQRSSELVLHISPPAAAGEGVIPSSR